MTTKIKCSWKQRENLVLWSTDKWKNWSKKKHIYQVYSEQPFSELTSLHSWIKIFIQLMTNARLRNKFLKETIPKNRLACVLSMRENGKQYYGGYSVPQHLGYMNISRKFLTLMTSQLMTSYRETNITKKKSKLEFHSNHWC